MERILNPIYGLCIVPSFWGNVDFLSSLRSSDVDVLSLAPSKPAEEDDQPVFFQQTSTKLQQAERGLLISYAIPIHSK